jgi:hypothetical protein
MGLVQCRVDADLPQPGVIYPQADGLSALGPGLPRPANVRLDVAVEVGGVEALVDGAQIEALAARLQRSPRPSRAPHPGSLLPGVGLQCGLGAHVLSRHEGGDGAHRGLGCIEEEVVDAHAHALRPAAEADQGGAVIGEGEVDRQAQQPRQPPRKLGGAGQDFRARRQRAMLGGRGSRLDR